MKPRKLTLLPLARAAAPFIVVDRTVAGALLCLYRRVPPGRNKSRQEWPLETLFNTKHKTWTRLKRVLKAMGKSTEDLTSFRTDAVQVHFLVKSKRRVAPGQPHPDRVRAPLCVLFGQSVSCLLCVCVCQANVRVSVRVFVCVYCIVL